MPRKQEELSLSDLGGSARVKKVSIPSLGGCVFIKEITAEALLDFLDEYYLVDESGEAAMIEGKKSRAAFALAKASICDKDGNLVADTEEGFAELRRITLAPLKELQTAISELNGLDGVTPRKNLKVQGEVSPIN